MKKNNSLHLPNLKKICYLEMNVMKRLELIDWTLEKYKVAGTATNITKNQQNEQTVLTNIIDELGKKRDIVRHKKKQTLFKDEVSMYRLEEATIDNVLFTIRELTGKLV